MSRESYLKTKNIMHTYSRSPLAEGQVNFDQATIRSGHTVSYNDVRADEIPKIYTIEDRDENYLTGETGSRQTGGEKGKDFINVIKFIENGKLDEILHTNGESYSIFEEKENDDELKYLKNWIDPSDAPTDSYSFSNGYEIRLFVDVQSGVNSFKKVQLHRNIGWDFDPLNGIIHFSQNFNPNSKEWKDKYINPRIEGFVYIGNYVPSTKEFDKRIEEKNSILNNRISQSLRIQPYKFSSDNMVRLGEPYQNKNTAENFKMCDWYQTVSFVVPGYCFEITSCDIHETILTEMKHLENGDTQIFIDLPWDLNHDLPIIGYHTYDNEPNEKYPILGIYTFIATTFIREDGTKLFVNNMIDFTKNNLCLINVPGKEDNYKPDNLNISPYKVGEFISNCENCKKCNLTNLNNEN